MSYDISAYHLGNEIAHTNKSSFPKMLTDLGFGWDDIELKMFSLDDMKRLFYDKISNNFHNLQ